MSLSDSFSDNVRPLLAARAATDPNAARLLEMFTKADEIVSECSLQQIGERRKAEIRASSGIVAAKSPSAHHCT